MIPISPRFLIGLVGSLVLALSTLQMTVASRVDGRYLPVGHDAFYHASRILDAVNTGDIAQFDSRMHAPEGDWITWPWAYDAVIASVVRVVSAWTGIEPMSIAAHVPPLLGLLGLWLVVAVASLLGLATGLTAVAAGCFALHAFSQYQFGVGALDHHGAEQLAVLGCLALGLHWLRRPDSVFRAAAVGLWLGLAIGIHASLIVLQLPLLAAIVVQWIKREPVGLKPCVAVALGLLGGALLILIPADTFWQLRFDLYYLSWLQLYASAATAMVLLAVARWQFSWRSLTGVALLAVVLAIPLAASLRFTAAFIAGDLPAIAEIDEIRSPFAFLYDPSGLRRLNQMYTLLIWLAPITCAAAIYGAARERDRALRFFWVWAATGLLALMLQVRLGSLGIVFLYLPLLVLLQRFLAARPAHQATRNAVLVAVAFGVAYLPTLVFQLGGKRIPSMDQSYSTARHVMPALAEACDRDPGIVLAGPGDGHLIRYFTKCSVISNNFRLTSTDREKIAESLRLIGLKPSALSVEAPYVRYVVARLVPPAESPDPVLFDALLNPKGDSRGGFEPIVQVGSAGQDGSRVNFFGVFVAPGSAEDLDADQLDGL